MADFGGVRGDYRVTTGDSAFERIFGMGYFECLAQDAEAAETFDAAMATAYDLSGLNTVVDVGGGQGAMLAAVLNPNPSMHGILFDLPSVMDGARKAIAAEGVGERCTFVSGDFFESLLAGGDAYMLK